MRFKVDDGQSQWFHAINIMGSFEIHITDADVHRKIAEMDFSDEETERWQDTHVYEFLGLDSDGEWVYSTLYDGSESPAYPLLNLAMSVLCIQKDE